MSNTDYFSPVPTWTLFKKLGGIIPIFIAGIWVATLVMSIFVFVQERRVAAQMTSTTATVIGHVVREGLVFDKPAIIYNLDLTFYTSATQSARVLQPVDKAKFDQIKDGETLPIWFFRNDPTISELDFSPISAGMKALSVINLGFLILILATLVAPILRTRSALRARAKGRWFDATVTGVKTDWPPTQDGKMARLQWQDEDGQDGESMRHLETKMESYPTGRRIKVALDGDQTWWIEDIGQEF